VWLASRIRGGGLKPWGRCRCDEVLEDEAAVAAHILANGGMLANPGRPGAELVLELLHTNGEKYGTVDTTTRQGAGYERKI
jgi:hypothetical protein